MNLTSGIPNILNSICLDSCHIPQCGLALSSRIPRNFSSWAYVLTPPVGTQVSRCRTTQLSCSSHERQLFHFSIWFHTVGVGVLYTLLPPPFRDIKICAFQANKAIQKEFHFGEAPDRGEMRFPVFPVISSSFSQASSRCIDALHHRAQYQLPIQ